MVAVHPENTYVASGSRDGVVRLWDPDSGQLVHELQGHREAIYRLKFSADGQNLCSAGYDEDFRIWGISSSPECSKVIERPKQVWKTFLVLNTPC